MRRFFEIVFALLLVSVALSDDFQGSRFYKEIPRKDEKELRVKISGGFGNIVISPGGDDKIAVIDGYIRKGRKDFKRYVEVSYNIEGEVGYLDIDALSLSSSEGRWEIKLCDDLPLSLEIELGASKAELDLGGMSVKSLKISTGASTTSIRFDKPNKIVMRRFEIESGVAKFDGEKLGNANFRKLIYQGGIGTSELDFSGELLDNAEIYVSIGMGNLTIYLPSSVGAKINQSGFLFSKRYEKFFLEGSEYISFNYKRVRKKVNIYIEAGLGNVSVMWID